ncbi:MAG: CBS domain-containing protein [Candidatus Microsaccharimonas sp.]
MSIFLGILAVLFLGGLVLASAMQPVRSTLSLKELRRRAKTSDSYTLELDRYELYPAVVTLLRVLRAVFLVVLTCLLIAAFGWLIGIVLAVVVAIFYGSVGRLAAAKKASSSLYAKIEPKLLDFAARFIKVLEALREPSVKIRESVPKVHSQEELSDLIEHSGEVVGENERRLLTAALAFPGKKVKSIMTPRAKIDSIKHTEFLGPLVLDELHALGHSRLPVINKDLDTVVGILHLRDLLSLDVRNSMTAENAMEKKVFYINQNDTLEHALATFLKARHHLFIVTNDALETVGLVTLEDVMEALIGRRIISEEGNHADL